MVSAAWMPSGSPRPDTSLSLHHSRTAIVFEHLRQSIEDLLQRATRPEDRRSAMIRMKSTLVQVRMGVDDLREALAQTKRRLEVEQRELETVRRRKTMAERIQDKETIAIAERFERQHDERVRLLTEKLAVQEREVAMGERELEEMTAELRKVMAGGGIGAPPGGSPLEDPLADPLEDTSAARAKQELDALARERARSEREAEADRRLEELKRKMSGE